MKDQAKQWLLLAEEDLKVSQIILKEAIYSQVCFHSQQAAEKLLKALIEEKQAVPKEHRLLKLFQICLKLGYQIKELQEKLEFLDKFYTSTRYPFIVGMVPGGSPAQKDASTALKYAEEIRSAVTSILEKD